MAWRCWYCGEPSKPGEVCPCRKPKDEVNCADLFDATMEYISDLFTTSPKESFSKADVLVVLNLVRNDPEITDILRQSCTKQ